MNAQNAIDQLPDDSTDPREDPRLNDPAFVATDEGQALIEAAAKADAQARKDAKAAEAKAKREAAAAKAQADAEARKPGPVEIVRPATPAPKPSARGKGAKAAKPKSGTVAKPAASKAAKPAKQPHTPSNAALPLGTKPIKVGDVQQYPILGKDGKALANYQEHNWVWTCPKCTRRLRLAVCTGPKDGSAKHAKVDAPAGYMRESRIVK